MKTVFNDKLCEECGERPGELNSRFLHFQEGSDQECGDWVCYECECYFA
jgi:hypothetical protein